MSNIEWEQRLCLRLNAPTLINDYALPTGSIIGNPQMGFQIDLMQVWKLVGMSRPKHPLRWINSYKGTEAVNLVRELYPEDENVLVTWDFFEEPDLLLQTAAAFCKDQEFDFGVWKDNTNSILVNPYIAHKYITRVFNRHKHTLVHKDVSKEFTYRGFTFQGTSDFGIALYDPIQALDDDYLYTRNSELAKRIRELVSSSHAAPVLLSDIWEFGREELRKEGVQFLPDGLSQADQLAYLGLKPYPRSKNYSQKLLKERYKAMAPARARMVVSRPGRNAYILVSREMCKFMVDRFLLEGLIQLPKLQVEE